MTNFDDDPDFEAALAAHRASEARGEIIRDGVRFDAERDLTTNSALRAQLHDALEMLRQANQTNANLSQALDAQTEFNARLFKQIEELQARQESMKQTLSDLSARIQ